jgi:hypothetical protein
MVLEGYKWYEENGLKNLLSDHIKCMGKEGLIERLHAMRDYALSALKTKDPHDCADVLDDIMPYFLGIIGDTEREL